MEQIQISKNFFLDEYIPKEHYYLGYNILIRKLNPKLIESDQMLRDQFGEVTINNWSLNGSRNFSGWRPYDCNFPCGYSDHREGNASDKLFTVDRDDVIKYIKENYKELGITIIEDFPGMTWVHTSVAYTGKDELIIVSPSIRTKGNN